MMRRLLAGAAVVACTLGVTLAGSGTANAADSWSFQAALDPITVNRVTGNGASWITVTGNTAEVKIQVNGLLDGAPHAQHIHVDAQGSARPQPQQHNGLPSITVADGAPFYGPIGTSLTIDGDTSRPHGLAVTQFPSTGSYTYSRTIELDPNVVANLQKGTAVLVVHGIDYNNNGTVRRRAGRQRTRSEPAGRGHRPGAVRHLRADADGRGAGRPGGHRRRVDGGWRGFTDLRDRPRAGPWPGGGAGRRRSRGRRPAAPDRGRLIDRSGASR